MHELGKNKHQTQRGVVFPRQCCWAAAFVLLCPASAQECDLTPLSWPPDDRVEIKESQITGACLGLFAKGKPFEADEFVASYPGEFVVSTEETYSNPYSVSIDLKSSTFDRIVLKTEKGLKFLAVQDFFRRMEVENTSMHYPSIGPRACDLLVPGNAAAFGSRGNDVAFLPNISVDEYEDRVRALSNAILLPVLRRHENGSYIFLEDAPIAVFATTYIRPGAEVFYSYGAVYWDEHYVQDNCPNDLHPEHPRYVVWDEDYFDDGYWGHTIGCPPFRLPDGYETRYGGGGVRGIKPR